MNQKIPLYHICIEFANSVNEAQSPLYFADLYWAELNHDMIRLLAIQNMTDTIIIRFAVFIMMYIHWIAKHWQNRCSLVRPDTHLAELRRRFNPG